MKLETSNSDRAFTIVEILVVVALLSFIILGLVTMFGQTQKALLASTTQVEVLELGRATADLVGRDLEQLAPSYSNAPNFFVQLETVPYFSPFHQPLASTNELRTNVMQQLFFVTRYNQQLNAVGYSLVLTGPGVGSLYRANYSGITNLNNAFNNFLTFFNNLTNFPAGVYTNVSRIAEGVVQFRVQAFNLNGSNIFTPYSSVYNPSGTILLTYKPAATSDDYYFVGNAVPAYVEFEAGFLETRTYDRYKGFANTNIAASYLANHSAQVHLFKLRIPIRNVDPSAYQ